ncbi:hypothetical protein KHA80_15390 [Anaerobacillus sp. HL2]|nr:hypothetical protein KHA80_15390 [Anaerobacillus sp. HL2]
MQKINGKIIFIGSFLPSLLFGVAMGNVVVGIPMDSMQIIQGRFSD